VTQSTPAVISTSVQPGADITSGSITENPASTEIVELVAVETLATLHIDALHATRNEPVSIVEPGVIIRVSEQDADELIDKVWLAKSTGAAWLISIICLTRPCRERMALFAL
jgi:hypothetical protein